jgi:hypothetical protein
MSKLIKRKQYGFFEFYLGDIDKILSRLIAWFPDEIPQFSTEHDIDFLPHPLTIDLNHWLLYIPFCWLKQLPEITWLFCLNVINLSKIIN